MNNSSDNLPSLPPVPAIPGHVKTLLGRPPVLRSEDENAYYELLAHAVAAIRPHDIIGYVNAKIYTDIVWEMQRYSRFRSDTIDLMWKEALRRTIVSHLVEGGDFTEEKMVNLFYKDEKNKNMVLDFLKPFGVDEDSITAFASVLAAPHTTPIDINLARLDRRAAAIIQEDQRRQQYLAWRAQQSPHVIEAKAEEIPISPSLQIPAFEDGKP
jgi:hypothetical protein